MQEREDEGKKVGKKGLFELSLCAKQLPELPGRRRRREEELSRSPSLSFFLALFVSLRVANIADTESIGESRDAARKCRSLLLLLLLSLLVLFSRSDRFRVS